ncbi:glutamate synthase subunit beta [Streptacidiphilus jiangxiensis]|uniref:Glutamate synthase (NADPH/NADH) small chain n=1 Tax=Streptacidiphilus jiangxiensis TaxID=235985 RepID=A0A1H7HIV9_STRJI|nr:glutamate synthase subunit beta [Streptacidiphilus jiangxiensis]SEK50336.1 glutamate synthase (NADPH/NADH) small chain [Streptacidiphilus jiangxiensis]
MEKRHNPDIWDFLRTPRQDWPLRPVAERVADWQEVHASGRALPLVTEQASRCMDCGIPFCHHACPLGNLIPEWNALAAREDWQEAAERLHATNNFPEFTGFLCPAPCESGCVLGIDDAPVAIKAVEAALAVRAWEEEWEPPRPPERHSGRSVGVVGSGPAGLACAQQLTRAGHTVVVYERDDRPGGLLRYGIPAFKMDKSFLDRRLAQLAAEGTVFRTDMDIGGGGTDAGRLLTRHDAVVVAVGATAARELPVPGRELSGVHQAMAYLTQANRVLEGDYPCPPISAEGRHVVIIGGGDTGADCLGTALRQGAASVVQLDIKPQPGVERAEDEPWPVHARVHRVSPAHQEGGELVREGAVVAGDRDGLPREEALRDVRVFSAATVRFDGDPDGRVTALSLAGAESGTRRPLPGTERVIPVDLVLLALGFSGPESAGLAAPLALRSTPTGAFARDAHYAAGLPGVFVAGDAGRGQSLVVWAIAEGRAAAACVDAYLSPDGTTALPMPVAPGDRPLTL